MAGSTILFHTDSYAKSEVRNTHLANAMKSAAEEILDLGNKDIDSVTVNLDTATNEWSVTIYYLLH